MKLHATDIHSTLEKLLKDAEQPVRNEADFALQQLETDAGCRSGD
jgi:hypothetical protein